MNAISKLAAATALGASVLALSTAGASAAIVCTEGACWHTQEAYEYPSDARVVVHPDSWRWADTDHYVWREHTGRGYWRGDDWTDF